MTGRQEYDRQRTLGKYMMLVMIGIYTCCPMLLDLPYTSRLSKFLVKIIEDTITFAVQRSTRNFQMIFAFGRKIVILNKLKK
jgi:hypothetical protein